MREMLAWLICIMGLLDFSKHLYKTLFSVHSKHSSFLPSADVKPMSNDLVHDMYALDKCMHVRCVYYDIYPDS
jgi:hypothetical protein